MDSEKEWFNVFIIFSPDFMDLCNYIPRRQGNSKLRESVAFIHRVGQLAISNVLKLIVSSFYQ